MVASPAPGKVWKTSIHTEPHQNYTKHRLTVCVILAFPVYGNKLFHAEIVLWWKFIDQNMATLPFVQNVKYIQIDIIWSCVTYTIHPIYVPYKLMYKRLVHLGRHNMQNHQCLKSNYLNTITLYLFCRPWDSIGKAILVISFIVIGFRKSRFNSVRGINRISFSDNNQFHRVGFGKSGMDDLDFSFLRY